MSILIMTNSTRALCEKDLYRTLSPAFVQSKQSSSHLYFVNSINELNNAFDDVSFCADRIQSSSLIETSKCCESTNKPDTITNIVTISIVSSIAIHTHSHSYSCWWRISKKTFEGKWDSKRIFSTNENQRMSSVWLYSDSMESSSGKCRNRIR